MSEPKNIVDAVLFATAAMLMMPAISDAEPVTTLATPPGVVLHMKGSSVVTGTLATPLPIPVRRPTVRVPLIYAANSFKSSSFFVPPMSLGRLLNPSLVHTPLKVQSVVLKHWAAAPLSRVLNVYYIDRNRMVYEVTTTFNTDYAVRGNHWSSGRRTFVVDAETGRILLSNVVGRMTKNAGLDRATHFSTRRH